MKHRNSLTSRSRRSRRRPTTRFISTNERLEPRTMLAADLISPFQNPENRYDVNNDGVISPRDVRAVLVDLREHGTRPLEAGAAEPEAAAFRVAAAPPSVSNFVDVNGDLSLTSADALSVIRQLNGEGEPGDVVTFRLTTTDLSGTPITTIASGNEFLLKVFVKDSQVTATDFGVFGAYLDVTYTANLATAVGPLTFGTTYQEGKAGTITTDGLLDEIGAFTGQSSPTGRNEFELVSVKMRADAVGQISFGSNAADQLPAHEVSIYDSDDAVAESDILYGSTTLNVTGSSQTAVQDLAGFAKALAAANVQLWTTSERAKGRVADQLNLFEDGESFLPIREALDPATGQLNAAAQAAGVTTLNTWIFPGDNNRSNGPLLTLAEIATQSGVAIPTGFTPSIAPIADVTVLNGSPLHIPLDGYDPNGDPLTYTVTSSNPNLVTSFIPTGNRSLRFITDEAGTTLGNLVFQLFEDRAPRATDHIIQLAEDGFYDDVTFHRVINNFVIQGGDPTGTGTGGSDLPNFDDQFHVDLQHNRSGILSMAKGNDDTNDSQFFVTELDTTAPEKLRGLDFNHTIFGQLIEGERVRQTISNVSTRRDNITEQEDIPNLPINISSATVFEDTENSIVMLKASQSTGTVDITVTATDIAGNSTTETFRVTLAADTFNGNPFLGDIPAQTFKPGDAITFQLTSTDVEGDPVVYFASTSLTGASANVSTSGLVTVTPPSASFAGTIPVNVSVAASNNGPRDSQLVNVLVAPVGPTSVDLLAVSDVGFSTTDNLTSLTQLQFTVAGVTTGATVRLQFNGTTFGEGVATGNTITITTSNLSALGSGTYNVTAQQVINEQTSQSSPALSVTLDQTPPVAITNTPPLTAAVGQAYVYNATHPDEGTTGFRYGVSNAPQGMTIDVQTGVISWTPNSSQGGPQSFVISVTDAAGNSANRTSNVTVIGGDVTIRLAAVSADGTPISGVALNQSFKLRVFVSDQRSTPTGISDAFVDVVYDQAKISLDGPLNFGPSFPNGRTGTTTTAGLIDEVGGTTTTALGAGEFLLVEIPFKATTLGTVVFSANPAELTGSGIRFSGTTTFVPTSELFFVDSTISILTVGTELKANNDTSNVQEDSTNNRLDVLVNDTLGPNSQIIQISGATTPNNAGTATISNDGQSIIYTPAPNFFGTETFSYTIRDGQSTTSTGQVTVTVAGINDPPVANDNNYPADFNTGDIGLTALVEDGTTAIPLAVISNDSNSPDSDVDPLELFSITAIGTTGTSGTVTIGTGGLGVTYTPAPNFFGEDTFTYTITDRHTPALSDTATVKVIVPEVNDPPVAQNDSFTSVPSGLPFQITAAQLTGNDNAGPLETAQTLKIVSVTPTNGGGTVVLNANGSVTYTPRTGFVGSDSFTYKIEDNGTTRGTAAPLQATGTVNLTIVSAPAAFNDAISVAGNSTNVTLNVLQNDVPSVTGATLEIQSVSATNKEGIVTISTDKKTLVYTPKNGFIGTETFTYTVVEGTKTSTATVTLTVLDPNAVTNSSFSGFAFLDLDNDGLKDSNEKGLSGITVRLAGTTSTGSAVNLSKQTDSAGRFEFATLSRGTYTITQEQPMFFLDGIDSPDTGVTRSGNDTFSVTVGDTILVSNNNMFAERGLSPQYSRIDNLASNRGNGFLTATANGQSQWIQNAVGWDTLSDINVALNAARTEVTITATNASSQRVRVVVPTSDKSRVHLLGRDGNNILMRIVGGSSNFTFTNVPASSSATSASRIAAAVDQIFTAESD